MAESKAALEEQLLSPSGLLRLVVAARDDRGESLRKTLSQYLNTREVLAHRIERFIAYILSAAIQAQAKENAENIRRELFLSLNNFFMLLPDDIAAIVSEAMREFWATEEDELKAQLVTFFYQQIFLDFDTMLGIPSNLSARLRKIVASIPERYKNEVYSKIVLFGEESQDAATKKKLQGFLNILSSIDSDSYTGFQKWRKAEEELKLKAAADRKALLELAHEFVSNTPSSAQLVPGKVIAWLFPSPAMRSLDDKRAFLEALAQAKAESKSDSQEAKNIEFGYEFVRYLTSTRDAAMQQQEALLRSVRTEQDYLLLIVCISNANSLPPDRRPIFNIQFLTDVLSVAPTPNLFALTIDLILGSRILRLNAGEVLSSANVLEIVAGVLKNLSATKNYEEYRKICASLVNLEHPGINANLADVRMASTLFYELSQCTPSTMSNLVMRLSREEITWVSELNDEARKVFVGVTGNLGEPFLAAVAARISEEAVRAKINAERERQQQQAAQLRSEAVYLAARDPRLERAAKEGFEFLVKLGSERKLALYLASRQPEFKSDFSATQKRNVEFWGYLLSPTADAARQLFEEYRKRDYLLSALCLEYSSRLRNPPIFTIPELVEILFSAPTQQAFKFVEHLILERSPENRLRTASGPLSDNDIQTIVELLVEKLSEGQKKEEQAIKMLSGLEGMFGGHESKKGADERGCGAYIGILRSSKNENIKTALAQEEAKVQAKTDKSVRKH